MSSPCPKGFHAALQDGNFAARLSWTKVIWIFPTQEAAFWANPVDSAEASNSTQNTDTCWPRTSAHRGRITRALFVGPREPSTRPNRLIPKGMAGRDFNGCLGNTRQWASPSAASSLGCSWTATDQTRKEDFSRVSASLPKSMPGMVQKAQKCAAESAAAAASRCSHWERLGDWKVDSRRRSGWRLEKQLTNGYLSKKRSRHSSSRWTN